MEKRTRNEGDRINRKSLLQGIASESVERRGLLKGTLGVFASLFGLSHRSAASDVNRAELLTTAQKYHSEQAIRDAIQQHADDLLKELVEQGYLAKPSTNELPVGKLLTAEAYANANEGAMVFAIENDGRPAPRIELTKRLSKKQKLIFVVRPAEERAYAVVKPTEQAPTFGDPTGETITTQDECSGCYDIGCHCSIGCSPYDNCTCYDVCQTNCDCCYTDGDCSPCDEEYSC